MRFTAQSPAGRHDPRRAVAGGLPLAAACRSPRRPVASSAQVSIAFQIDAGGTSRMK